VAAAGPVFGPFMGSVSPPESFCGKAPVAVSPSPPLSHPAIVKTAAINTTAKPKNTPCFFFMENILKIGWADMKRELRDTASFHALFETAIYKYWS
jgi:hypothetical protein